MASAPSKHPETIRVLLDGGGWHRQWKRIPADSTRHIHYGISPDHTGIMVSIYRPKYPFGDPHWNIWGCVAHVELSPDFIEDSWLIPARDSTD